MRKYTLICVMTSLVALSATGRCLADNAGDALLQKCKDAEKALKSLRATCYTTTGSNGDLKHSKVQVFFRKPNYARTVVVQGASLLSGNIYSDGRLLTTFDPTASEYSSVPVDPSGANVGMQSEMRAGLVVAPFFAPAILDQITGGESPHLAGTEVVAGVRCRVLACKRGDTLAIRMAIGPDDLLRAIELRDSGPKHFVMRSEISDLHANVAATPRQFAWRPPAGVKEQRNNAPPSGAAISQDLLKAGTVAPEFKLPELHGAAMVTLSGVYPAHKVTLLNFWDAG
jgi:outer membrane lipoprotein-sorting protein